MTLSEVWPWALCMVITHVRYRGNYNVKGSSRSHGARLTLGIGTLFPSRVSRRISVSSIFLWILLPDMCHCKGLLWCLNSWEELPLHLPNLYVWCHPWQCETYGGETLEGSSQPAAHPHREPEHSDSWGRHQVDKATPPHLCLVCLHCSGTVWHMHTSLSCSCQSCDKKIYFRPDQFDLLLCRSCGSAFKLEEKPCVGGEVCKWSLKSS